MRDNIETDYLIFISSDGKKTGFDIFKDRIKENKWPIHVEFENINIFNKSLSIRDHINNLDFIKNKKKYGLYFQGGICKINKQSFEYINANN